MIAEKLILETDKLISESKKREDKLISELKKREEKLISESKKREKKREEKAKLEVAKNMLKAGMSIELIGELTKLPLNKIKSLQLKDAGIDQKV